MMLSNYYFTTIISGEIALQLQRFLKHYITIKLYTMAITNNVSICKPSGEATFMQHIHLLCIKMAGDYTNLFSPGVI